MPTNEPTDSEKYLLGLTTTDQETLRTLANHPDRFVRARVASNKHTPVDILKKLSTDPDIGVPASVASNEKTSPALLAQMIERALYGGDTTSIVLSAIAANPRTPTDFLENLFVQSVYWGVRIGLAGNPATSHKVLKKLSELPIEKTANIADANKEIREVAMSRLKGGLPCGSASKRADAVAGPDSSAAP